MGEDAFDIIGRVVDGRYRVERVAGQGGFGVVYRAFHLGFQANIALKVLKLPRDWSSARREARVRSFQRECRVLFELSQLHPAIVRAFETGSLWVGNLPAPYLSLEWLDGVSLDRELRHRRSRSLPSFELDEVLALLDGPAAGFARAHAQGIAHRDIKPGNLFIVAARDEPSVKILDFGIAKLVDDALVEHADEAKASGSSGVTGTTSFTPMYAAPEQWAPGLGPTGPWTDVHALALVCTELLSGRVPFSGNDSERFREACLDGTARPTPGQLGVTLTPAVEAVFSRALALEPRERYREVGAFWHALSAAAGWSPDKARPVAVLSAAAKAHVGGPDRDAPASSLSIATGSKATRVTVSRAVSRVSSRRSRLRGLGLAATLVGTAFGVVAMRARARVETPLPSAGVAASPKSPEKAPNSVHAEDEPRAFPVRAVAASASAPTTAATATKPAELGRRPLRAVPRHLLPAAPSAHVDPGAESDEETRLSARVPPVREFPEERALTEVDLDDPGLSHRK